MGNSKESSKPVADANVQRMRLGGNGGGVCARELKSTRTTWSAWRGDAALVTWVILGMHILERKCGQGAHAVARTQAEESQYYQDRGRTMEIHTATMPTSTGKFPQRNWTSLGHIWSTPSASLPVLPFASQPVVVQPAWAERAANVARNGEVRRGRLHGDTTQLDAEQSLPELQSESAAKEHRLEPEELQAQCAKLNLDCSYIRKWLFQHVGEDAKWNGTTSAAVSTALDKAAALAQKTKHQQATTGTSVRTDEETQSRRVTHEVDRLLQELVARPLLVPHLQGGMRGSNLTEASGESANQPLADDAEKESIGVETARREVAGVSAAAAPVGRPPSAGSDSISLSTTEGEKFWGDQEGSDSENSLLDDVADSGKIHLLLSQAIDSLKQNKALQRVLELPLHREAGGAETKDGVPVLVGDFGGDGAEIHEDESHPGDLGKGHIISGDTDVLMVSEGNGEDILNNAGVRITSGAARVVDHHQGQPFQIPPHRIRSMARVRIEGAANHERMGPTKTLTISQLKRLLRIRREQQRRRSPSRPMIFPSCYFDAPMQKRMRAKASVLTAELEQLNDAVEALTELGEVVEKQAEAVEKAAFTLVYRDRLVGEPMPPAKPLMADDTVRGGEKREMRSTRENVENPFSAAVKNTFGNVGATVEEKEQSEQSPPELTQGSDTIAVPAEGQPKFQSSQAEEDMYKKLLGANGVRKQLRELFATWELARRAAGASEMANEIMRRAESLRREFVTPLQHDVQQLKFLDASTNPKNMAMHRLLGCKGFIKAVRRTGSRAEEDLYNLGAHAFASEVSLPLMAHDLQQHLADLLEHVVQLQLQQHRALHIRAASLQALHRSFFRSARILQQEATERLRDTRLLLATSAEEWHKLAQHLGAGIFELHVDLARQLVALRSVDKKAARLEGILNFLYGGLEHLLQVEGQLQRVRRNSGLRELWLVLDDEEMSNEFSVPNKAERWPSVVPPVEGLAFSQKEDSPDSVGLMSRRHRQHRIQQDTSDNGIPYRQSRVVHAADDPLLLELPPQIEGKGGLNSSNRNVSGEKPEQDQGKSTKILQRLLVGVTRMWEYLQMYKRQSSDAEHLLRSRFYIAQQSVQKATLVAQTVMVQSLMLNRKQQEQSLREKLPSLVQTIQRQELARAQAEAAVEDSAVHVQQLNRKVRFVDAALSFIDGSAGEEHPATGREVVARIDRINSRLFLNIPSDADEWKRSHQTALHQDEADTEEISNDGSAGVVNGGTTPDKDTDSTREMLGRDLVSALEALQEAQYQHAQRKQELEAVEAALRQNRMSLEVHLRILDEIRQASDPRLSRVMSARYRKGTTQMPTPESVDGHLMDTNYKKTTKGQHMLAIGGPLLAAAADALAAAAARGKKVPVPPRTPGRVTPKTKKSTATGTATLHRMSHMEQKTVKQDGA